MEVVFKQTEMFKLSLTFGGMPVKLIPLFKKGGSDKARNYRSVSPTSSGKEVNGKNLGKAS